MGQRPRSHAPTAAAVVLAAVLLLSTASVLSPRGPSPGAPATKVSPSLGQTPALALPASSPSSAPGTSTACGQSVPGATPARLGSAAPVGGGAAAAPLFNAQVQPYAEYTGHLGYVAAGAAMRDLGFGWINISWPGTLVAAYMTWAIISNNIPSAAATLNGATLNGTWTSYADPSPCWDPTYIYTFVAGVTSLIVNGTNHLTNFPSSVTDGANPFSPTQVSPLLEGATLIAIYSTHATTTQQVTFYSGALTAIQASITATLNYTAATTRSARTTYIVADGQLAGNTAQWNGSTIDTNAFPGSAPRSSSVAWTQGNLWDTKTYTVNVTVGSNTTTAGISAAASGDCITWVGQVLSVNVSAPAPPYSVTFQEQGLPSGSTYSLTTGGSTKSTTVVRSVTSLSFSLTNGSYTFSVGAVAGYSTTYSGTYQILGGPLYLRLPFHQVLYTATINETGLPSTYTWWVDFNTTGVPSNTSSDAGSPLSYEVPNGTYHYFVGTSTIFYVPRSGSGSIPVLGANVLVNIPIPPPTLYAVTFKETGLPGGQSWGGTTSASSWGTFVNSSTAPTSIVLYLPNDTFTSYSFSPYSVSSYHVPSTLSFVVDGAAQTVLVPYELLYTVYFNTTTLPTTITWQITLGNSNYSVDGSGGTGSAHNITVGAPNGTFVYAIYPGSSIYTPHPFSAKLNVSGRYAAVLVVFTHPPFYTLTVAEQGLLSGTSWTATVEANVSATSTTTTLSSFTLQLPNSTGTIYGSSSALYNEPESGFGIAGKARTITLNFSELYRLTFPETGLPNGTGYDVDLYNASTKALIGSDYGYAGYGSLYWSTFSEIGGQYSFETTATGYSALPAAGNVTINGGNLLYPLTFVAKGQAQVKFNAVNLPDGVSWAVVFGGVWQNASWSPISFSSANGTVDYSVPGATGYAASPASGMLVVAGKPAQVNITFTLTAIAYVVTFTESGLPDGATWFLNVTGQAPQRSTVGSGTGTKILLDLTNATYTYLVATSWKNWSTVASGDFQVKGAPLAVGVTFAAVLYSVAFEETGLPNGATWYVNVTGQVPASLTISGASGTQLAIHLGNGTYPFEVATDWKNWSSSSSGSVEVSGSNRAFPVTFTELTYPVTFSESGLPNGATWYVNVSGFASQSATVYGQPTVRLPAVGVGGGTSITLDLSNGSFGYTVATNEKNWSTAAPGPLSVAGAAVEVKLDWTNALFAVSFLETGLPQGATWYVNLSGGPSLSATVAGSSGTELTVPLGNGTYSFSVGTNEKNWSTQAAGPLTVDGASTSVNVPFAPVTYAVSFEETGLADGTGWSVELGGAKGSSTTDTLSFSVANGSYPYTVFPPTGYSVDRPSGLVAVSGAGTAVALTFAVLPPSEYAVTFSESGLPAGTTWIVNVTGQLGARSDGAVIEFELANGTYGYTVAVGTASWGAIPSVGNVTVNGADVALSVSFLPVYPVIVTQTDLPAGTAWYVNVTGTPSGGVARRASDASPVTLHFSGSGSAIAFSLPNGTWSYTIGSSVASWVPTSSGGSLTVAGAAVAPIHVPFVAAYPLTFSESGLPSATVWSVTVNGTTKSASGPSITFYEPNGTWEYVLGGVPGWTTSSFRSSSPITGAGSSVAIEWSQVTYLVTFTESGLPSGTSWSVTVGATSRNSTGPSIDFVEANATFPFTIAPVHGYGASPSSGSFRVSGSPTGVSVAFTPTSGSTGFLGLPGLTGYALLGLVGAVAVIVALLVVLRRSKSRPEPPA